MFQDLVHGYLELTDKHAHSREWVYYLAGSFAALTLDLTLLVMLVERVGLHYLLAAAIGFCAGALLLYGLSVRYIFQERRLRGNEAAELGIFVAVGIAGLVLTQLGLFAGVELLSLPYLLAKVLIVTAVFWFNYLTRRWLLFSVKQPVLVWPTIHR